MNLTITVTIPITIEDLRDELQDDDHEYTQSQLLEIFIERLTSGIVAQGYHVTTSIQ